MTKDEMRKEICQLIKKAAEIAPEKVFAESAEDALHTIVYGAGNMGRNFEQFAKNLLPELKVSCFLDRDADNKPEFLGYRVYKPDDTRLSTDFRRESIVVLALVLTQENSYDELKDQLRALGYTRFINPFGMVISHEARDLDDREVFEGNKCRILEAFDLLQDENSREVFLSILNAYTTLDCSLPILSPGMTQYVDVNVPFRNQYHTFVDCGAFIGDTLKELVKRHKVEQYFGFEPDMQSYERLLWQTDALRWKKQSVLLPLGVGEKNGFLRFCAVAGEVSRLDEEGNTTVQVVRLDDILKGYDNLMIKMDIEGAEVEALKGAKGIILEMKPDLAVCVYHRVSDLWQVILMLNK